jgi:N-acetylglutamate synthase
MAVLPAQVNAPLVGVDHPAGAEIGAKGVVPKERRDGLCRSTWRRAGVGPAPAARGAAPAAMTGSGAGRTAGLAWRVEETCLNAFPALQQVLLGDWLLRFAPGVSRRANSVNPRGPRCRRRAAAIAAAERLYPARGLPAIFRVLTLADPALDRALAARGYTMEGETCVLWGAIGGLAAAADPEVRLLEAPAPAWLAAMARLQGHTPAQAPTYRRIVEAIAIPVRFAQIAEGGAPAALAYGAIHDGLLCYESVVTAPDRRRRGLARRVIAALAAWAREEGAQGACLQVEAGNAPARALYAGFGLAGELYRYHYRRAPSRT